MQVVNKLSYPVNLLNGHLVLPSGKINPDGSKTFEPNELTAEQWAPSHGHPDILRYIANGDFVVTIADDEKAVIEKIKAQFDADMRDRLSKMTAPALDTQQAQNEAAGKAAVTGLLSALGFNSVDELKAKLNAAPAPAPETPKAETETGKVDGADGKASKKAGADGKKDGES